eukprot:CAMPEP_0177307088 /NCGR_PEP_ID=MMETSP0368-20130122/8060_1 /TAXON_ID=447022 ORGANISM="Scrippsiella hangoei-like, Strain SHHI-4" /NCGR_SAMPLE_ID=MMETSP0368 /ASSEMBLY_ACC=CAM_ASM_000363 /LENGTH=110 /DNA_ID=CAMNT_0018765839 /DNA_START=705 /DNA_END=1036 /DNA_ORIENTATION=+
MAEEPFLLLQMGTTPATCLEVPSVWPIAQRRPQPSTQGASPEVALETDLVDFADGADSEDRAGAADSKLRANASASCASSSASSSAPTPSKQMGNQETRGGTAKLEGHLE